LSSQQPSQKLLFSILLVTTIVLAIALNITWFYFTQKLQQQTVEITNLENTIQNLKNQLQTKEAEINNLNSKIDELNKQIADLKRYKLKEFSSIKELKAFLEEDDTDARNYETCVDYALRLRINAIKQGYNVSLALANYQLYDYAASHAFNAVYINGELIYIEPQTDKIFYDVKELIADLYREYYPYISPYDVQILDEAIVW